MDDFALCRGGVFYTKEKKKRNIVMPNIRFTSMMTLDEIQKDINVLLIMLSLF